MELPRGTPVSKGVVEKPEGDCWQRRGHVNVDPAWMVDELRLCIGIWLSMLSRRMGATERVLPAESGAHWIDSMQIALEEGRMLTP